MQPRHHAYRNSAHVYSIFTLPTAAYYRFKLDLEECRIFYIMRAHLPHAALVFTYLYKRKSLITSTVEFS